MTCVQKCRLKGRESILEPVWLHSNVTWLQFRVNGLKKKSASKICGAFETEFKKKKKNDDGLRNSRMFKGKEFRNITVPLLKDCLLGDGFDL